MNYKLIASHESYDKYSLGVKILATDCTDEEILFVQQLSNEIHNGILRIREKNNPENIVLRVETIDKLINCFTAPIYAKQIPSKYSIDDFIPWLIVTTTKGPIKIGWRKRVISIDWSESDINNLAKELFPDEDVTMGEKFIHAWGYDKAKQYIEVLMK